MIGHLPKSRVRGANYKYGFSGCYFDLDARFGTNTKTDLAAISSWSDQIAGVSYTHATAGNQPRYIAADSNFNNFPSIQRQTSARWLGSINGVGIRQGFTLVYVGKVDTNNGANSCLENNPTLGGSAGDIILALTPTVLLGSDAADLTTAIDNTSPFILVANTNELWINGVQQVTGNIKLTRTINTLGRNGSGSNDVGRTTRLMLFEGIGGSSFAQLSDNVNKDYLAY